MSTRSKRGYPSAIGGTGERGRDPHFVFWGMFDAPPEGMKILLIDDDVAILRALRRLLTRNHQVETALGVSDAVKRIRQGQPDVIVCDQNLIGSSGTALHAAVRSEDPESARRFVFMSGNADARPEHLRSGNDWIQKPFRVATLVAAVDRLGPRDEHADRFSHGSTPFSHPERRVVA